MTVPSEQTMYRRAIGDIQAYPKRLGVDVVDSLKTPDISVACNNATIKLHLEEENKYLNIEETKDIETKTEQSKSTFHIKIQLSENLPEKFKSDLANGMTTIECQKFNISYKHLRHLREKGSLNWDSLAGAEFTFRSFDNFGDRHSVILVLGTLENPTGALKFAYAKTAKSLQNAIAAQSKRD